MLLTLRLESDKCIGCFACTVACKLEHDLPPHPVRPPLGNPEGPELIRVHQVGPQVRGDEVHQSFQLVVCRHCPDAPCIAACPTSAIRRDIETGIVLVNEEACIGCLACLPVCPYGAPQFHEGQLMLCDMCVHRLAEERHEGSYTACEAACPARAIHVVTVDEASAMAGEKPSGQAGTTDREPS